MRVGRRRESAAKWEHEGDAAEEQQEEHQEEEEDDALDYRRHLQQDRLLQEVEVEEAHHDDANASRLRTGCRREMMGAVRSGSWHSLRSSDLVKRSRL